MAKYARHSMLLSGYFRRGLKSFSNRLPKLDVSDVEKSTPEQIAAYRKAIDHLMFLRAASVDGGGTKGKNRHVMRNKKLLIRDRIKRIIDPGTEIFEIGDLAGFEMDYGDIPGAGVVGGIGTVHGIFCMISGNDATVKGGSYYPITTSKSYRLQQIALQNGLPCIYIPDSGGAFLPLQSEVFPDKKHGGRNFYNQALMSSYGIPQVAVVGGSCTAGGAYNPTMSDHAIVIDGISKIFLGGPPLVRAALGETVSDEELGGAFLHSSVSGCVDYFARNEDEAMNMCRDVILSSNFPTLNSLRTEEFEKPLNQIFWDGKPQVGTQSSQNPDFEGKKIFNKTEMYALLGNMIDGSKFLEFKAFFGTGLITGTAHFKGNLAGIVASTGTQIESQEALKCAHFVNWCNRRNLPIIFFQNSSRETMCTVDNNCLRDRSKMIASIASSNVPKISITMTHCSSTDQLLMCGPSFSPNFHFMWPGTTLQGFDMTIYEESRNADCFSCAAQLITDSIILPQNTRSIISDVLKVFCQTEALKIVPSGNDAPIIRM